MHIPVQDFFSYKKRSAYFSNRYLIAKRRNQQLSHVPVTCGKQVSCSWCCRCDEYHVKGTKHSRHGRKTSWVCVTCQVPLCKVKRYGGKSCFELFHEAKELFNPCSVAAQEGLVVRRPGSSNIRRCGLFSFILMLSCIMQILNER